MGKNNEHMEAIIEHLKSINALMEQKNELLMQENDVLKGNNDLLKRLNEGLLAILKLMIEQNDIMMPWNDVLLRKDDHLIPVYELMLFAERNKELLEAKTNEPEPVLERKKGVTDPEEALLRGKERQAEREQRIRRAIERAVFKHFGKSLQIKTRSRFTDLLFMLWKQGKVTRSVFMVRFGISEATMNRTVFLLRKHDWICFWGHRQRGGYELGYSMKLLLEGID